MAPTSNLNVGVYHMEHGLRDPGRSAENYSRTGRYRRGRTHNIQNIFLFLLIVILCPEPTFAASIGKGNGKVCMSAQCQHFAESLNKTMDFSVNPCDNFYQYVCGNFNTTKDSLQRLTDWFVRNNEFAGYPKPVQQAKDLFDVCMDTDEVNQTAYSLLRAVNLPRHPSVVGGLDLSTYHFNWLDTIIKIKTRLDENVLIFFDVGFDPKNLAVFTLTMGAPQSSIIIQRIENEKRHYIPENPDLSHLISTKRRPEISTLHSEIPAAEVDQYLRLISLYSDNQLNESQYLNMSQTFNDFSLKINKLIEDYGQNMCEPDGLNAYSVNEIQSHTDKYVQSNNGTTQPIWKRYLEGVFNASDVKLDFERDKVLLCSSDMKYLEKLALLISQTHPVTLELYIWIRVVNTITDNAKKLKLELDSNDKERSRYCAALTNKMLPLAAAYIITPRDKFDSVKHRRIQCMSQPYSENVLLAIFGEMALTMMDGIKLALEEIVANNQWMDVQTKQSTYEKIRKMSFAIGVPEWLFEPGKIEEYYKGLEVNRNATLLENKLNINSLLFSKYLNLYLNGDFNSLWVRDLLETNAAYSPKRNAFTVNLMMTREPYFDLGLDSLNYGALGAVVGHEISHGLDPGLKYYINGNVSQWWSNNSIEHFSNKTKCFVDQYSSFNTSEIIVEILNGLALNIQVDGQRTLHEDVADISGVRAALLALQHRLQEDGPEEKLPYFTNMTTEQLFFLSFAHMYCEAPTKDYLRYLLLAGVHSPNMFRVRGTLQNSEEFAKAWNCPLGSRMNPDRERCVIF